jgi:hypothetical protein
MGTCLFAICVFLGELGFELRASRSQSLFAVLLQEPFINTLQYHKKKKKLSV